MSTRGFENFTATDVANLSKRLTVKAKPSKYHAQKTTVDGIVFDSKRESERYLELKALEKAGEIAHLVLQPVFMLYAPGVDFGTSVQLGRYIADFSYEGEDGLVVEDVKGMATLPLYRWKKKHVEAQYGIQVVEVR